MVWAVRWCDTDSLSVVGGDCGTNSKVYVAVGEANTLSVNSIIELNP